MRKKEAELFGSSAAGTGCLQFLPVRTLNNVRSVSWDCVTKNQEGLKYLAYGVNQRQALLAPLGFELSIIVRSGMDDSVREALMLMGLLGGIGARSRRGWGSLSLQILEDEGQVLWTAPKNREELETEWRSLERYCLSADTPSSQLPPFTVLSHLTRIYLLEEGQDATTILNHTGKEFQRYRSFGRAGKVGGHPAEQNFREDHDLMLSVIQRTIPHRAPERTIFGLPHNYYFSSKKAGASVTSSTQRRASPLFFHVQKLSNAYGVVVGILPAVFVPDPVLQINTQASRYSVPADIDSYYGRIEKFVTGTHPLDGSRRFPEEVSMWC